MSNILKRKEYSRSQQKQREIIKKYFLGSAVNLQDIYLALKRNANKSKRQAELIAPTTSYTNYWVSDRIRKVWEPRIVSIAKVREEIELLSVSDGSRPCCMTSMDNHELLSFADQHPELSIFLDRYSQFTRNLEHDVIITRQDSKIPFEKIEMCDAPLGYPSCCYDYFCDEDDVFPLKNWRRALNTKRSKINDSIIDVECTPEANFLLMSMNLAAIPHMPCSFDCKETISNGIKTTSLLIFLSLPVTF